jgi:pilus assembly protein CpaE
MAAPISILLVDDAPDSRVTLRRLLSTASFAVCGEVGSGTEAVALARDTRPDVVVLSLEEPVARPLKSIEALTIAAPETPVVVVSSLADKEYLRRAMVAGARDFVGHPLTQEELARTISTVVEVDRKRRSLSQDVLENGHRGELIAMFAGKGGVGKSTLATNLAVAMSMEAKQKQRVAIVDFDLLLGDVAIMLDVTPERTMADLVPLIDKLDPELLRSFLHVHTSGAKVLCAPTRVEDSEQLTPERVRKILDVLARTFDYVIVDLPRTFDDRVVTALDMANMIMLVTNYDVPCLKSTKVCLDTLRSWRYSEDKLKLVINHANRTNGLGPGEAEGALDYPVFWKVPSDFAVAGTSNHGKPFVQGQAATKLAQNITGLASNLMGARAQAQDRGLLSRLLERD